MQKFIICISLSFLLAACGTTRTIEFASLNQTPCKDEITIGNPKEFTGETVNELKLFQQEKILFASMAVKTYCTGKIIFSAEIKNSQIKLFLQNSSRLKEDCVCTIIVTVSLKNIEPGDYSIMVLNEKGDKLLAASKVTVN